MPKYCSYCEEMIYTPYCPYCERPAGKFRWEDDVDFEPEVDEGYSAWGSDGDNITVLSFDDVFGTDSE